MDVIIQGKRKQVSERLGLALIQMGTARPVPAAAEEPKEQQDPASTKGATATEDSTPRKTGNKRPRKRNYKRRDMKAED